MDVTVLFATVKVSVKLAALCLAEVDSKVCVLVKQEGSIGLLAHVAPSTESVDEHVHSGNGK